MSDTTLWDRLLADDPLEPMPDTKPEGRAVATSRRGPPDLIRELDGRIVDVIPAASEPSASPADYAFYVGENQTDGAFACIVPRSYFRTHRCMEDRELTELHPLLVDQLGFEEATSGTFLPPAEYEVGVPGLTTQLRNQGFVEDWAFTQYMQSLVR